MSSLLLKTIIREYKILPLYTQKALVGLLVGGVLTTSAYYDNNPLWMFALGVILSYICDDILEGIIIILATLTGQILGYLVGNLILGIILPVITGTAIGFKKMSINK